MPRGDKTGPTGAGPQTGRAAGYCAGYSIPGYMNPPAGYGRGQRRGRGRRWGRGFGRARFCYPQPVNVQPIVLQQTPEQEVTALENYQKQLEAEKNDLEQEMGGVKARILELKEKITE